MSRLTDLSARERQRLIQEEGRARAKAEDHAVTVGVMETLTLDHQRGAEFLAPEQKRGERPKPIRRMTGLEWLHRKGKITNEQMAVGERYGALWRAARGETSIRSNLNQSPAGDRGSNMHRMLGEAGHRINAGKHLATMQGTLSHQPALMAALDLVAGQELTPREASRNGAEAAAMEALVTVGLYLLAKADHEANDRA